MIYKIDQLMIMIYKIDQLMIMIYVYQVLLLVTKFINYCIDNMVVSPSAKAYLQQYYITLNVKK